MLLKIKLFTVGGAICAYAMKRFAVAHAFFDFQRQNARTDLGELIAGLVCIPCFKASHLFFKLAYSINQARLRRLRGQDFFLQFYNRRVATGSIVNVLQSLRDIERGLDGAQASINFTPSPLENKPCPI